MTRATWDRIARLADRTFELENSYQYEEADRLDARINEILLKAGIDQCPPDWDMVWTDWENGTIEVYNTKGKLIRAYNVLEARPKAA